MANLDNVFDLSKLRTVSQLNGRIKNFFTDAEIIEFAKNYDCPHYILTHPITKGEIFLFIHAEVDQWLVDRYMKRNRCIMPQVIHVNNFSYEECKVTPLHRVPKELIEMKDLYYLSPFMRTTPPGVYFLCRELTIVYIGQSINAGRRVQEHLNEKEKQFDDVFFIPCHVSSLNAVEGALIRLLQPEYNTRMVTISCEIDDKEILQTLQISA